MPAWVHSTWFLATACTGALLAGGGAGVAVSGDGGGEPRTVVTTDTETETETITETETETETETVPTSDGGAGGGGGRGDADDEDGDDCSDSYDAVSCVSPYEGVDDLNCADVDATDIEVVGEPYDDPYGFDGYDGDGVGCES